MHRYSRVGKVDTCFVEREKIQTEDDSSVKTFEAVELNSEFFCCGDGRETESYFSCSVMGERVRGS